MSAISPFQTQRKKQIKSLVFLIVMIVASLIGVSQLKVVRDFFSQASAAPADLVIDTQLIVGPMPRPWRYLAQGGEDHAWRIAELTPKVKSLNPEYIRLDHLYDFYDIVQGTPGNLTFDFTKLDLVISDIVATGAKPYLALSYMPPAISSGDILAPPTNWADWQLTVQKTIEHVSGDLKIRDVCYEVWNEPDLFGGWKYYGSKNYLTLYDYAARGALRARSNQNVLPFKIGGPAITALYKNWFYAVAKYAVNNNLPLDFFSWHRYSNDLEQYEKDMADVKSWVESFPQLQPVLEFHITEWGHDSNNHVGYDTNYAAAHSVAGAISMVGSVQKAFLFEIQDGKDPAGQALWGRWGLFTHNDAGAASKPRYQGLRMLDSLADQRLQLTGNGGFVKALAAKKENDNTQVVIANFDARGAHTEMVPVTFNNIEPGNYQLVLSYLNGNQQNIKLATTAAVLKTQVNMPANSVVMGELIKN